MKILILSDGRMGHVNQSIAFAKHLRAEYEIISLSFKHSAFKALSYVLDKCGIHTLLIVKFEKPLTSSYDFIVSAGSTTYYGNKTLAKKLKTKSVTMMLPKGYRYDFDLIFAQNHDNPPSQENIIEIPANFSFMEPKGLFRPTKKSVGIIIGGNNPHFTMHPLDIKYYLDFIFKHYSDYEIAVTTSPRTPSDIELLIKNYPFSYCAIFSQDKVNPIADFLHHCEVVFITIDSTSMISESISYSHSCIEILPLSENKSNKFLIFAQNLEKKGYVHLFDKSIGHMNKKIDFHHYAQKALS